MSGQPVERPRTATARASCRPAILALAAFLAPACTSPFGSEGVRDFGPALEAAIEREIATAREAPTLVTTQPPAEVEKELAGRRRQLDALSPAMESNPTPFSLGADLTGREQTTVAVDLRGAIATAVKNNLGIESSRFGPAINREDVIDAEAIFDVVLFGGADMNKVDQPNPTVVLNGLLLGVPFNASETYRFETGVRKRLRGGGSAELSTDLTRYRDNSPGFRTSPDPAYTAVTRLTLTQPLLRGFGEEVNTAEIRLARNAEGRSTEALRGDLLQLAADTETAYWDLVFAWRDIEIRQWLVDVGDVVRGNLAGRRVLDTKPAEYSDAVARVEQRRADVIRARRAVRVASDRLKVLINDPMLSIGDEAVLRPVDELMDTPIEYNLRDAIVSALDNRPEIEVAILGIDDASIRQLVADNARLPLLDLSAQVAYFGQDDDASTAYGNVLDADFIDYILGLIFEYPLGNRGPEAAFRRARLRRSQSLVEYRRAVQDVVLDVKSALRDVVTSYELIQATRSFRVAEAENLRTLEAEEPLRGMTPEFLNLKFQRQDGLALARREELKALVDFDQSLADLYRAMGTSLAMRGIDVVVEETGE